MSRYYSTPGNPQALEFIRQVVDGSYDEDGRLCREYVNAAVVREVGTGVELEIEDQELTEIRSYEFDPESGMLDREWMPQ